MSVSPTCANTIAKVKRNAVRVGGVNGIRALSRALGIVVDDSADVVKCDEFAGQVEGFGIHLSEAEKAALFKWLDRSAEGILCPAEFVAALRHVDSPLRRSLVHRVVNVFRKDAQGNIRVAEIRRRFRPERHPLVLRGEKSADEVGQQLADSFSDDGNPSGAVSIAELEQYFAGLSAVVDTDERFAALLRGCWDLPHFDREVTKEMSLQPDSDTGLSVHLTVDEKTQVLLRATVKKALGDTFDAHARQLLQSAAGLRAVGLALRSIDAEKTGFVGRSEFFEALAQVRLYVERPEVFQMMDVNQNGTIDYMWYLHAVAGELPPARRLAAERLWKRVPTDDENCVELSWLHKNFVTHSPDELSVFFDAWDQRRATGAKEAGGRPRVTAFEFLNEWLVPVSARIAKDADFAAHLTATWPADLNNESSNRASPLASTVDRKNATGKSSTLGRTK
jgi:Ca2+-binding EF-hand superfamily protein